MQVPLEDLERAARLIAEALQIRYRYMKMSNQTFCVTTERFLNPDIKDEEHDDKQTIEGTRVFHFEPSNLKIWKTNLKVLENQFEKFGKPICRIYLNN